MTLSRPLGLAFATLLVGSAAAQNDNYLCRTLHYEATWAGFVFGSAIATGGDALDTIAAAELTDFGIDNVAAPNKQLITGMSWGLQDFDASTTHQYGLIGYPEDPVTPGQPDVANPFLNIGPFTSPASTGIRAWIFTVGFTTPIQAPREQNIYIGLKLPAAASVADILTMNYIDDDDSNNNGPNSSLIFSQPGQSFAVNYAGPATSHLLGVDAVSQVPSFSTRPGSMLLDLEVRGPGGHAMTLSNELTNPAVTAPASFVTTPHTALYPDAVDFNQTSPARADTMGYVYQDNAFLPSQDLVVFLASFWLNPLNSTANNGPFPISSVLAGSSGNVCVDLSLNASLGLFLAPTSTGPGTPAEQYFEVALPLNSSAVFQGLQFVVQGFTMATATRTVRGGPCSVQTF